MNSFEIEIVKRTGTLLTGGPQTGKTSLLAQAGLRALAATSSGDLLVVVPELPDPITELLPLKRIAAHTAGTLATQILREFAEQLGGRVALRVTDETEMFSLFCEAAQPLLDLAWPLLLEGAVDPEVSGMRDPTRFLATTYRMIRRLRAAQIDWKTLRDMAGRGTTKFYAQPPNFSDTDLLSATKAEYRDSLAITAAIFDHQRRRESDLGTIVATLYESFERLGFERGILGEIDAIVLITAALRDRPEVASAVRDTYAFALIDDAQDLVPADVALLKAIFGDELRGALCAANLDGALTGFRGGLGERAKDICALHISLDARDDAATAAFFAETQLSYPDPPRSPVLDAVYETALAGPQKRVAIAGLGRSASSNPDDDAIPVRLCRAKSKEAEAQIVARYVRERIDSGAAPEDCAIIAQSLDCIERFVAALLDADIPINVSGRQDLLADRRCADYYSLLQIIVDPRKHDHLLRILESPMFALSDRSIALLCMTAPEPALFPVATPQPGKRETTLSDNIFKGGNDDRLSPQAQTRVAELRTMLHDMQPQDEELSAYLLRVATATGLFVGTDARSRYAAHAVARFIERLGQLAKQSGRSGAAALPLLLQAFDRERSLEIGDSRASAIRDRGAVTIASVDAVRGVHFPYVAVVDARAGAFPRYYTPDAFLFSPKYGFIPKENVGGAHPARTAKFTWYSHAAATRAVYNRQERRKFAYAVARATRGLMISASGRATRAVNTPEFVEELRAVSIPGTRDISGSS